LSERSPDYVASEAFEPRLDAGLAQHVLHVGRHLVDGRVEGRCGHEGADPAGL
jgi:hypothetical protein